MPQKQVASRKGAEGGNGRNGVACSVASGRRSTPSCARAAASPSHGRAWQGGARAKSCGPQAGGGASSWRGAAAAFAPGRGGECLWRRDVSSSEDDASSAASPPSTPGSGTSMPSDVSRRLLLSATPCFSQFCRVECVAWFVGGVRGRWGGSQGVEPGAREWSPGSRSGARGQEAEPGPASFPGPAPFSVRHREGGPLQGSEPAGLGTHPFPPPFSNTFPPSHAQARHQPAPCPARPRISRALP